MFSCGRRPSLQVAHRTWCAQDLARTVARKQPIRKLIAHTTWCAQDLARTVARKDPDRKLIAQYIRSVSYTHLTLPTTPYV